MYENLLRKSGIQLNYDEDVDTRSRVTATATA